MQPVELAKGIYWVGAVDWDIRSFHGPALSTHRGTTYNAYLILDEHPTLVDTVWGPFTDVLRDNIRKIIDPARLEYVVANHVETDHSGALPAVMAAAPAAKVVCSPRGRDGLRKHYFGDWHYQVVKTGDSISIGRRTLSFVEAPMLHWPDSMFTYLVEDQILMPNDAFGQHIATGFRFDDQVRMDEVMEEAQKYYANILTPFSPLVTRKLEEVSKMGIPIKMIAPSHGIIWRKDPGRIVEAYARWAQPGGDKSCVILYDTMWGATRRMAEEIGQGITDGGVDVKILRASATDTNDIIAEIHKSKGLVAGAPTVNRGILVHVTKVLDELVGLKPAGKVAAAFGSYGWSGEAPPEIEAKLRKAGAEIVSEPLKVKWVPDDTEVQACRDFGRQVAGAIVRE
jgi:flavorubredoxin